MIRVLSWNVNGLRAVLKKGFLDWLAGESPDVLCLQEIKALESQLPAEALSPPGYFVNIHSAEKLGYSGVATFSKIKPIAVRKGLGVARLDHEGRVLETEFEKFTLLNIYFPNGQMREQRLRFKLDFYEEVLRYLQELRKKGKRVVVAGDYNTAHKPIDLTHPEENKNTSGFLPEERAWMDRLIGEGFVDSFRHFNSAGEQYTWWDLRTRSRERNVGWRIDYHFVSDDLIPLLKEASIRPEVHGSDHCPVGICLNL